MPFASFEFEPDYDVRKASLSSRSSVSSDTKEGAAPGLMSWFAR